MNLLNKQYRTSDNNVINYYETENSNPVILIIHAQGTNSISYAKVVKDLSKKFHIILVDCYGHGKSSHMMVLAVTLHNIPEGMAVRSCLCRSASKKYRNNHDRSNCISYWYCNTKFS